MALSTSLNPDLRGSEVVYRELGRRLHEGILGTDGSEVRTRFVIDLISCTSAGGINGVLLAKALALDASLDALTDLWVNEGDIARLLNDISSEEDLRVVGLLRSRQVGSFLNSRRMYLKLLDAIRKIPPATSDGAPSP